MVPKNKLSGKVAVVTGSSQGIGKAIALELLRAGANVVLNARNADKLEQTLAEFRGLGYSPLAVPGDVTDFSICRQLVQETVSHFGRLDILVNNAGGGFRGAFSDTPPEVFKKVVDSNLMNAVYCTRAALEEIVRAGGSIIFISSLSGIRGLPLNGPYCVAKMGLTALAQTLRLELRPKGVHIGLVMVGLTDFDDDKRVVSADGSLIQIRRGAHQTREQVARIVLKTIARRKFQVVLTPLGKVNAIAQRISPALVEWIINRSGRTAAYNQ
jgi:NAD(P)-dependent dehydrogenase (short-subunit alcohol dehydrogenase family)